MSRIDRWRTRTYQVLEGTMHRDWASRVVQGFILTLIILNVTAVVLATVQRLDARYGTFFRMFEIFSVAIFTVEYLLRVWVSVEKEGFDRPILGRLRFMVTPAALIDLFAILPFFLPRVAGDLDLRAIRALRIFRLFRLMKLGRYSTSITLLVGVLRDKKEQIGVALVAVLVVLVLASSAMYFVERRVQPEHFSSIPDAMWWGIVTLTTVGYGDVHPTTTIGKVLGGIISLMGIGLFALPAGILSSGFEQALEERHGEAGQQEDDEGRASGEGRYCPHCGSDLAGRGSEGREEPTTSSGGR